MYIIHKNLTSAGQKKMAPTCFQEVNTAWNLPGAMLSLANKWELVSKPFIQKCGYSPPRDNFRQQLVYHCSTYQITVRFHAYKFVILLIFFVPGQIQKKSCSLPKQLQVLSFPETSPIDFRHFWLSATCIELNIAWFTDETTCELVVSPFLSLENCYPPVRKCCFTETKTQSDCDISIRRRKIISELWLWRFVRSL